MFHVYLVYSPPPVLESSRIGHFSKDFVLLIGEWCLEIKIWAAGVLVVTGTLLFLGSLSRQRLKLFVCVHNLFFYVYTYIPVCTLKTMSSYWFRQFQFNTIRLIHSRPPPFSLSVTSSSNREKLVLCLYGIFIYLFNPSIHIRKFQDFGHTSLWETGIITRKQYWYIVLFVFSLIVSNQNAIFQSYSE